MEIVDQYVRVVRFYGCARIYLSAESNIRSIVPPFVNCITAFVFLFKRYSRVKNEHICIRTKNMGWHLVAIGDLNAREILPRTKFHGNVSFSIQLSH